MKNESIASKITSIDLGCCLLARLAQTPSLRYNEKGKKEQKHKNSEAVF